MKVSIITVCYNNLSGLKVTAESIISQTSKDYEWIVIDGDSTDGTKEYLKGISQYITCCVSEPDGGIYDAMNKGIRHAKCDYMLFMNSGDKFIKPDSLQSAIELFPAKGDILYADAIYHYPDHDKEVIHPDNFTLHHFWITYCPCHQAAFIKSDILHDEGYDATYRICADYKNWLKWMVEEKEFVHLPVVMTDYMADGISTTNQPLHKKEHDRAIKEILTPKRILEMQYIDQLKNFYEDAVQTRETRIHVECNEVARCKSEIDKRDQEIAKRDQEIEKKNLIINSKTIHIKNLKHIVCFVILFYSLLAVVGIAVIFIN